MQKLLTKCLLISTKKPLISVITTMVPSKSSCSSCKSSNLLLNGQIGIAVGMATNIPPHNLGELVDAAVEMIDNEHVTIDDILKHVKGPDFPTGAVVYGGAPMKQAYLTGRGSVTMRAVANIEETKRSPSDYRN